MRSRIIVICLALAGLMALAVPAAAAAAKKKRANASAPSITRVTPMRVSVGATLVIRGKRFSPKRKRNTVIFRAPSGRTAFAKPRRASRRKLVVKVPTTVAKLVSRRSNKAVPTRFKLRVLSGRFSRWTTRRLSPVIVSPSGGPGEGGGPGGGDGACGTGGDWDGDLLPNSLEATLKTDPCLADSDLDGVEDGYEEQSAIDLNHYPRTPPLPYPGKRPYPNALDPSDAFTDYDGDGLELRDEFIAWVRFQADGVPRSGRPTTLSGLLYSDGLQKSIDPAPAAPPITTLAGWALDIDSNGELWDDERDADGDGLSNWDESHGRMLETWWPAQHDGQNEPKESAYPTLTFLDTNDLPNRDAHADFDIDGDGVGDGADDNDHDGVSNQFEVRRPYGEDPGGGIAYWMDEAFTGDPLGWNDDPPTVWGWGANVWAYSNPFNPCKPFDSERCHEHPPFGYYASDDLPPIGPAPPGGFPGGGPVTPAG
jgi:hypothetical protein